MSKKGRFGDYGGQYVPEIAMPALNELEEAYLKYREDEEFLTEFRSYLRDYAGRPTNLYFAERLTQHYGKANIYLKREDLLHTGAHKINNALGQALLAKRMGKKRIVAETGAGQHGVATATVAALFGMECHIFMGAVDVERQRLNVFRMRLLGATVIPVSSGTGTLKDATSEAIRYWATNITDTYYVIGSAVGPHPYPEMVRDFQKIIGEEIRAQAKERFDAKPNYLVACIGGGSNAIGTFYDFRNDSDVKKFCVEGGGRGDADGDNAKTLSGAGTPGILHGAYSYLLQDEDGQVVEAGDTIHCHYYGIVFAGESDFDNSFDRGGALSFQIGVGMVIPGWDQGLVGKRVGDRVLLSIPAELGYGARGAPQAGIPGGATLVFVTDRLGVA